MHDILIEIMSSTVIKGFNQLYFSACSHLPKLQACLQSSDVNFRIAAGETIALLVELGRDVNEVNKRTPFGYVWEQSLKLKYEINMVHSSFNIPLFPNQCFKDFSDLKSCYYYSPCV